MSSYDPSSDGAPPEPVEVTIENMSDAAALVFAGAFRRRAPFSSPPFFCDFCCAPGLLQNAAPPTALTHTAHAPPSHLLPSGPVGHAQFFAKYVEARVLYFQHKVAALEEEEAASFNELRKTHKVDPLNERAVAAAFASDKTKTKLALSTYQELTRKLSKEKALLARVERLALDLNTLMNTEPEKNFNMELDQAKMVSLARQRGAPSAESAAVR